MRTMVAYLAVVVLLLLVAPAWAQGPTAPPVPTPTCEERLNFQLAQRGGAVEQNGKLLQELAQMSQQLLTVTKERDDAKAALTKPAPKPEEKK